MTWYAIILAAGRGPDDPMAKAYHVSHKCSVPVAGVPMLARVVASLEKCPEIGPISISIDNRDIAKEILGPKAQHIKILSAEHSAPSSALAAILQENHYPALITTGDHALLTPEMVSYFCHAALKNGADFSAGLATAETILHHYPQSIRTFFTLKNDRVSGCNLFAVTSPKGLKLLKRWQYLESVRKKPWRLVAAFGPQALFRFALGRLSLEEAFARISAKEGLKACPILLPFAEAAIDVDKPADHALAEEILSARNSQV